MIAYSRWMVGPREFGMSVCCNRRSPGRSSILPMLKPPMRSPWRRSRNHPFVDGNKRTGFVVGILFLELNGYRFIASEEDAARAVLELAAGTFDEADYGSFLRDNVKPAKDKVRPDEN